MTETNTKPVENNSNVYILGAGFSAAAGLPLMGGFLNQMRDSLDWLESEKRAPEITAIHNVFEFRRTAAAAALHLNINVENVEELFSLASLAPDDAGWSRSMRLAIAATLEAARRGPLPVEPIVPSKVITPDQASLELELPSFTSTRSDGLGRHHEGDAYDFAVANMLGRFSPAPSQKNTIITFNYDLVVERSLRRLKVQFDYGLDASQQPKDVSLLKLHGSLNWRNDGDKIQVLTDYDAVRAVNDAPAIIPPTWRKNFSIGMTNAWNRAINALESATRIYIIGFSMPATDLHFKYLLGSGLRQNISLRAVHIVDPGANDKPFVGRIEQLFRISSSLPVRLHRETALNFLCGGQYEQFLGRPPKTRLNVAIT